MITRDDHPSGSDRVFEALQIIDPNGSFKTILNLQGDLPEMDPGIPEALVTALDRSGADLATLVTPATAEEAVRPQVVKAAITWDNGCDQPATNASRFGTALYFSRAPIPAGATEYNHHVGVYGWRRSALSAFVRLPPSPLELTEKLEQLRALEAGMTIAVAQINAAPGGVDTNDDLIATRRRLGH